MAVAALYSGEEPHIDVSDVRAAGEPLKTFGGRASGPGPLVDLHRFVLETFRKARGRKLTSVEVHDIACKIGEIRCCRWRAALGLDFSLEPERPTNARCEVPANGGRPKNNAGSRNNSVAYTEKPEVGQFMEEWHSIFASKSGERGIFNREAARKQCDKNRSRF